MSDGRSESAKAALGDRRCAIADIVHRHGFQISIMFAKVLKGTAGADYSLVFDFSRREEVVRSVLDFVSAPRSGAAVVAGDFGVAVATLHHYMHITGQEVSRDALQSSATFSCVV